MTTFSRMSRLISSYPKAVAIGWGVAALLMFGVSQGLLNGESLEDRTQTGPPDVVGSDSYDVDHAFRAHRSDESTPYTLSISNVDVLDPAFVESVQASLAEVAAIEGVEEVVSPFMFPGGALFPGAAPLLAEDGDGFLIAAYISGTTSEDDFVAIIDLISPKYDDVMAAVTASQPDATSRTFSNVTFFHDFEAQIQKDLVSGELIALPIAFIVMVLVFGGFLAASTPMAGAFASIAGGFAVLYAFSYPIDLDSSAPNVVTVLGIGLCIDYGLLIVSRYREELSHGRRDGTLNLAHALDRTMNTAGRTVFFSAVTVAIAVGGMVLFTPDILRGFGGAAIGVVTMALISALTLVPAVAILYGERLIQPGVLHRVPGVRTLIRYTSDVESDEGMFSRLAARVQRRPWLVMGGTAAVLLLLASPLLNLEVRNSEAGLLPVTNENRQYLDDISLNYPLLAESAIQITAEASPDELQAWLPTLLEIDGVSSVDLAFALGDGSASGVRIDELDLGSPASLDITNAVRDAPAPFDFKVGGVAANQIDFLQSITDELPRALAIVISATFLLLFLMTGSLLVPIKTLLINSLSLSATVGILSWIFTEGHLQGVLGFTSVGGVETYVVVLVIAFGFGLSMDYEVFLLARIKELVDQGKSNADAVRLGLQRSGRIITSAALIIVIVFLGFASGQLLVIKEVGLGLALAVLLDATLVRMLLVPATMTLLDEKNWWAPKPLRKLHERFAIAH